MPITVFGINSADAMSLHSLRALQSLELTLKTAVASIPELGLTEKQVTCFFPQAYSGSSDIVAFVDGLFEKDERTAEIRDQLSEAIISCIQDGWSDSLRSECLVECVIHPFYRGCGFASSKE